MSTWFTRISPELVKVYSYVRSQGRYLTANEVAGRCGLNHRTANNHASKLAALGIFDRMEVSPGYRYRFSASAEVDRPAELARLEEARAAFSEAVATG